MTLPRMVRYKWAYLWCGLLAVVACRTFAESDAEDESRGGAAGQAGEPAEAEHGGEAGSRPTASAPSSEGGGGSPASEGVAGETSIFGGEEPVYRGTCAFGADRLPKTTAELAFSYTAAGVPQLLALDPTDSTTLVRWDDPSQSPHWTPWRCLEFLPGVKRLAGMNLSNDRAEVVAISHLEAGPEDTLYVRRQAEFWSPWLTMSVPLPGAQLSDVDAVGGTRSRVFVADRGRIFYRERVSEDAYSNYGPWHGLPANSADRVSVAQLSDGQDLVATLTTDGLIQALAVEKSGAVSEWVTLSRLELSDEPRADGPTSVRDMEAYAVSGVARLVLLDEQGKLWRQFVSGSVPAWEALTDDGEAKIESIAAPPSMKTEQVWGLVRAGGVMRLDPPSRSWEILAPSDVL